MRFPKVLFLLSALALAWLPVEAATINVAKPPAGNDAPGCGSPANPCATIQYGYDQSLDGDTILVGEGTYNECLLLTGIYDAAQNQRSVQLVAEAFDPGDPTTRELTVIDGFGVCPAGSSVVFAGGLDTSVEGFTITGGPASGVWGVGGTTITNNIIEANASSVGGGIYVYPFNCLYGEVTVTITNNTIRNNTVGFNGEPLSGLGGGMFVGLYPEEYYPGNPLTEPNACVGGGGTVLVQDNLLETNDTEFDGAAIYAFTNSIPGLGAQITITQNTITGNQAGLYGVADNVAYGGGIFATTFGYGPETIVVTNNQVLGNVATGHAGASYGGGIWAGAYAYFAADHSVTVDGNTVTQNTAGTGGGMEISSHVEDLEASQTVSVVASNNRISGNTATTDDVLGGGGGLSVGVFTQRTTAPGVTVVIEANTIRSNNADLDGGGAELRVIADAEDVLPPVTPGILSSTATLDFSNNLIVLNESSNITWQDGVGGGVMVFMQGFGPETFATANLDLNTIADNIVQTGSGGIEVESYTGFDTSFIGEGKAVLNINSVTVSDNPGFGLGGPLPGNEGIFTPGPNGGDTANQDINVEYSDLFANGGGNYEDWVVDRTGMNGNISEDPLLDALTHVPAECSPTLDAGDPSFDFSDEPNPDGGRVNMGHTGGTASATVSLADASGDGEVDGIDVLRVAVAFGSSFGDARWDRSADLDSNNLVDGNDLALIAGDFGESCP